MAGAGDLDHFCHSRTGIWKGKRLAWWLRTNCLGSGAQPAVSVWLDIQKDTGEGNAAVLVARSLRLVGCPCADQARGVWMTNGVRSNTSLQPTSALSRRLG